MKERVTRLAMTTSATVQGTMVVKPALLISVSYIFFVHLALGIFMIFRVMAKTLFLKALKVGLYDARNMHKNKPKQEEATSKQMQCKNKVIP